MKTWYALYSKPRQEALVARQLEEHGLETFFPQYSERRCGRPLQVRPLFPCYLFVRVDLEEVGISTLAWMPGLRRVVSFGGVPARVPDEAIALVRKRLAEVEARGGFIQPRFRSGERVRVRSGPLAGLEAVFEETLSPGDRVRILIRFLGEANRAVIPVEMIEPIAPQRHPPRRNRGRGRPIRTVER